MEAIGVSSPQPMAFSEVYGALQTGVVDGQENTWSNIYGQKFFEVQDGVITETNHGIIDYMVVTSGTDWWEGLDAPVRDQLATILQRSHRCAERRSLWCQRRLHVKSILDEGGVIRELTRRAASGMGRRDEAGLEPVRRRRRCTTTSTAAQEINASM